jgi:hypothetical protein
MPASPSTVTAAPTAGATGGIERGRESLPLRVTSDKRRTQQIRCHRHSVPRSGRLAELAVLYRDDPAMSRIEPAAHCHRQESAPDSGMRVRFGPTASRGPHFRGRRHKGGRFG